MNCISINNVFLNIYLVSTIVLVFITIFKSIYFKKFYIIDYSITLFPIILYILSNIIFKENLVSSIIFSLVSILCIIYITYELYKCSYISKCFNNKANTLIKNAQFDYYFCVDSKDYIIDASNSFKDLVGLSEEELYHTLGFQTLMSRLNITHINQKELTQALALDLNCDYTSTQKKTSYFELTILEQNEPTSLLGVIEPIFYKNQLIGRNIYLSKSNKQAINKLVMGLEKAKSVIQDDRSQLYVMMSLCKDVIMYYDYNTNKYVLTESIVTYLKLTKRELSIEEFFSLIHPDDYQYYQEQSKVLSSIESTRMKYRLKLGSSYHYVFEDAIYLHKNSNLISMISLFKEDVEITKKEEVQEVKEAIDYKAKLNDTIKVLDKLLGE